MSDIQSLVSQQLEALLENENNTVSNLSNAAALIFQNYENINWAGFYIYNTETQVLDLGPFQGKVACMHIQPGTGVVGAAFAHKKSMMVPNVHEFTGHIACDADSNAELVIPIYKNERVYGVIDIDSPELDRFTEIDKNEVEELAQVLAQHI
ncbi:GAF domain-containing protein [Leuconostoc carnosum]|uniref:GAF domain-containing protein n=2 Tax=Leuconostoc carnosum TaxID=1252 RepID=K0DAA5_LEUCJ|nr:GAF domain-containing protein [Leuconostoc carnosum]AFT81750.1 GAF domain-containing protein [Leuconostoc carnosum JB16]KAA8328347.1 GAF domain-containing protein [Leuconostoc carnosum]QEA32764.1 GAF domain-containing protein [Leuconostoc carnosum]